MKRKQIYSIILALFMGVCCQASVKHPKVLYAIDECGEEGIAVNWTGTYDTTFGQVILKQKKKYIVGTYRDLGAIRSLSVNGSDLFIEFDNKGTTGYAKWTKTSNGFQGKWGWNNSMNQGAWNGKKVPDAAQNYIKGMWSTPYGNLDFIHSKTGVMVAHYGEKGGMLWGNINNNTKIFKGKYCSNKGGRIKTCSFIFSNYDFKGKFEDREYGSWNGTRIRENSHSSNGQQGQATTAPKPLKIKVTMNSVKCNRADNIRGFEYGKLSLDNRIFEGLTAYQFTQKKYGRDLSSPTAVMNDDWGDRQTLHNSGKRRFAEGVSVELGEWGIYTIERSKVDRDKMEWVNGFHFSEGALKDAIFVDRSLNLKEIVKFLEGKTNASDYPLASGNSGRRKFPNSPDYFRLETSGGKRYVRGYGDLIDPKKGKIRFGYHYTIELVD
ncbi:hypothetical protein [Nonlabens xiamenensis]|uniref:hypothetical protein n=1 Tax=Nonlabens xiamenensis TaxID=2341043 RepID=UPI000F60EE21|nr:hypothetical protein [Nonlabens xiamenensis]